MTPSDSRPLAEWTSAELRRAICAAVEQIAQLETERHALEEIRDDFEAKEHDLTARLSSVKKDNASLADRFETEKRDLDKINADARAVARESASLRRQCTAIETRLRSLEREAAALEEEVRGHRGDVSSVENTLQLVHESIVRMDRKLGSTEERFSAPPPRAARRRRG